MFERQLGCVAVAEHDVGYAFVFFMAWNCYRRNGKRVREVEIQGDQPPGSALQQQARIFFEKLWIVAMHTGHEEIIFLSRTVLNSRDNRGTVPVSDLMCDHADGKCSLLAERTGKKVGAIVELSGGGNDSFTGSLGNVLG